MARTTRVVGVRAFSVAAWRRWSQATALRSALFFVLAFALLLPILYYGSEGIVLRGLTNGTARATAWTLRMLGAAGIAEGTVVTSSLFGVEVIGECTGLFAIVIFVAAVLAYPAGWGRKALGIVVGIPALLLVNLLRLVSLFYVGYWFPDFFETAHLVVWQSLMIAITVFLWLVWAARSQRPREAPST